MWTPFYFFAMPFVFADEGARHEPLGVKNVGGVDYDVIKVTFAPGTGDTPDDFYVAYLERPAGQLKIVSYIVTYPSLRQGKNIQELEQHAIVFDEWQTAFGLSVPSKTRLFNWKNEQLDGEPLGALEFSGVRFSVQEPERDRFKNRKAPSSRRSSKAETRSRNRREESRCKGRAPAFVSTTLFARKTNLSCLMPALSKEDKLRLLTILLESRHGDLREQNLNRQGKGHFHVSGWATKGSPRSACSCAMATSSPVTIAIARSCSGAESHPPSWRWIISRSAKAKATAGRCRRTTATRRKASGACRRQRARNYCRRAVSRGASARWETERRHHHDR
jgi:hypothetical protein